jgi:hypothetical protein
MKSKLPLLLALAAFAAPAGAADYVYMVSAGEMRSMIEQDSTKKTMMIGYISGVMDAQMRAHEFCVPDDTSLVDVGVRALKMMGEQPRESKAPAADVIAVFLHGDYPCRK